MQKMEVEVIFNAVIKSMNKCTEHTVKVQSIVEIKEGYSICLAIHRSDNSIVPYSGPIYALDKYTKMYYFMNPDCSMDEMNKIILRGRKNGLFRLKEKIVNFYYNKLVPC